MIATILRLLQPLSRWLGWSRVVLVVQRDDEVLVSTLPRVGLNGFAEVVAACSGSRL
jgi:hypothetical protein